MRFNLDASGLCTDEGPFYGETFTVIYFNQFIPAGRQSGIVHLTEEEKTHFPNSTPYFHIFRIGPHPTDIHSAAGITGRFITEEERQKYLSTRSSI